MVTKEKEKMKRKITKLFRLNLTHSGLARLRIGGKVITLSQFFIQILIRNVLSEILKLGVLLKLEEMFGTDVVNVQELWITGRVVSVASL